MLEFLRVWMLRFQLQVLILIDSSVLCGCLLIGRAKHVGQSVNCCTFFRGALQAFYFCIWRSPFGSACGAGAVPVGAAASLWAFSAPAGEVG